MLLNPTHPHPPPSYPPATHTHTSPTHTHTHPPHTHTPPPHTHTHTSPTHTPPQHTHTHTPPLCRGVLGVGRASGWPSHEQVRMLTGQALCVATSTSRGVSMQWGSPHRLSPIVPWLGRPDGRPAFSLREVVWRREASQCVCVCGGVCVCVWGGCVCGGGVCVGGGGVGGGEGGGWRGVGE